MRSHEPVVHNMDYYSAASSSVAAGGVMLLGVEAFGTPPAGLGADGLDAAGFGAAAAAEPPWLCQTSGPGITYLLLEATAESCIEYLKAVSFL
jgi:hypothetical protein